MPTLKLLAFFLLLLWANAPATAQPSEPDWGKSQLVFWPQVRIQNIQLKQVYSIQVNIAPELQLNLAKGLNFHGQVIVPLINQMEEEESRVRPGVIALSQRFKMGNSIYGVLSAGKFTNNRHGIDLRVVTFLDEGRITLGANFGITGYNTYISNRFVYTGINTFTWKLQAGYYMERFNSMVSANFGRYLMGDHGVRVNAVRFFSDVAVGFWAQYSGGEANGGFNFAIALPPKKYDRERKFRVRLPEYFFWEYRGRVWPEEGASYETQNDFFYFGNKGPLDQFNKVTIN